MSEIDVERISEWLDARSVTDGSPCLFAPDGGYDLELNRYFEHSAVRFRSLHEMTVIAQLTENSFHSLVICVWNVRVSFNPHSIERCAGSPNHATRVTLAIDFTQNRVSIK